MTAPRGAAALAGEHEIAPRLTEPDRLVEGARAWVGVISAGADERRLAAVVTESVQRVQADGASESAPLLLGPHADRFQLADAIGLVEPHERVRRDGAVAVDDDAVELRAPRCLAPPRLVDLGGAAGRRERRAVRGRAGR